jgi:hypothetical protein
MDLIIYGLFAIFVSLLASVAILLIAMAFRLSSVMLRGLSELEREMDARATARESLALGAGVERRPLKLVK